MVISLRFTEPPKTLKTSTPLRPEQASSTYLHLLQKTLARCPLEWYEQSTFLMLAEMEPALVAQIAAWVAESQSVFSRSYGFNPILRSLGMDSAPGETAIGLYRLDNIEQCIVSVLQHNVPGDLADAGVWRGGASIFMRAVLHAHGNTNRNVELNHSIRFADRGALRPAGVVFAGWFRLIPFGEG